MAGVEEFLSGGGEMGERVRSFDWSRTPLGEPAAWPQSLKTAVRITLTSSQPMFVWWGEELIHIYNDAYKAIVGGKHPAALGLPASVVWREIWDQVGPRADSVMRRNEGTYDESLLLIMERYGYPEETYYTFSCSPIPGDDGGTGGIICANTDDTARIIGERQVKLLRDLGAVAADARTAADACRLSIECLANGRRDLPFALLYLVDENRKNAVLAGSTGLEAGHAAAPKACDLGGATPWPFIETLEARPTRLVLDLDKLYTDLPKGAWDKAPRQAAVLPILPRASTGQSAVLVVGLNPYRLYDEGYEGFLNLLAGQIASGIANAEAYEQERKRAEALAEIDRAKTLFFSNVSHEFRTPLTLMLSPLETLLIRSPTAETIVCDRYELELMHRNGVRLLKLVNTLLDFSRIEAGRVEASYEPVDLGAYTADLASTFRSAMKRAGLDFVVDCPSLGEPVFVDRGMWERVVLNLISNAFKYTLQGEVRVALRPTDDGNAVELCVSDTGVGVPDDQIPHLFEHFHRVEGQRGRSQEGTGIGLALVQELVRLHGGSVRATSKLGEGSSFYVVIPTGSAHLPADRVLGRRAAPTPGIQADAFVEEAMRWLPGDADMSFPATEKDLLGPVDLPTIGGRRRRVLLADDNADMRDYLSRLLSTRFDVEAVADGNAALEAAWKNPPDLVLADVMMPRLDGFGLLKALRADPDLRFLPVVLLSARAGEEAKVEGLGVGADDYLVKPFNARELIARVTANLELSRLRRRARDVLVEETERLKILNRTGAAITAELDIEKVVQLVTDAAVELTGAKFGAFFFNVVNDKGESYTLYTLSGVPREAFSKFPMPRNTALFGPTFRGAGVIRIDDVLQDHRYGKSPPYHGMPPGHLPVRSYLAAPVISGNGEVLGGLFFGHPDPGVFTERDELIVTGIAGQAAIALDNAR
jgi:signal transduction histidine kinase/DNA-binding response OmpR family regulator